MSFKRFVRGSDVRSSTQEVNEVFALSGSVYSNDDNVKYYKNIVSASANYDLGGYFESLFDASPTSSLSTGLMDITYGYATGSTYNVAVTSTASVNEKVKTYGMFAEVLLGSKDSKFTIGGTEREDCFFISVRRNIKKDELKKGTVALTINTDEASSGIAQYTASDDGAVTAYKQDVGGHYAPLYLSGSGGTAVGQVWYQAGVIVIPADLMLGAVSTWSGSKTLIESQSSSSINQLNDGLRTHIERIDFHNQTNIHQTKYFCRAFNDEFNYSSNPTFVDGNYQIRVMSGSNIQKTRTYITTVGLYDAGDNLIAVGKVNKPISKSPDSEATLVLSLDF